MSLYDEIYEVAADRHGLITSAEAKALGGSDKELSRLASEGRLTRVGYGLYRIRHHVPEESDPYAEAVALVGPEAYLFGESVIALHQLAPTNPTRIFVATPRRVRRSLPRGIRVVKRESDELAVYDGIPSQTVAAAIASCAGKMMGDRLAQAAREARARGLLSEAELSEVFDRLGGEE